jgi:hypothetical protein
MKRIEIIISPQGETRLETKGFFGAECQQASQFLEHALGQATASQRTSEYYQSQAAAAISTTASPTQQ